MEPVGIALIGTGMWGRRLAAAVARTPALDLVTCFSRTAEKRVAFAAEFGCEAATSFEAALDHPRVEGVLLVTPNGLHAAQTAACAERGKHVFVEKPIADTLEDGRLMQQSAGSAGITLMVGHGFRRLGAARRVKELLEAGALGQVVLAEANFSLPGTLTPDKWRFYRDTCPGGPLMQLGIHHADTLQHWLGPIARVEGAFARLATSAEIDDVAAARLTFASGALGTLNCSYVSPKTYALRLYGTQANLHYETDMSIWPQAEKMDAATSLTLETRTGRERVDFDERDMLVEELAEFARCVRGERTPETGAAVGLASLAVIRQALLTAGQAD